MFWLQQIFVRGGDDGDLRGFLIEVEGRADAGLVPV